MGRLIKSAHFLPVRAKYSLNKLAQIFTDEIVRIYGVPFSTTFHPQTDGQSERMIQTLKGMLRTCLLQFRGDWEEKLPLVEFASNDNCQTSIEMSPIDVLYGK
ncbi:hypothetical protein L3X38_027422 [Prunus dulcis]|uniref:Integrase catalytic domain-containing protein n=1 Tax=Prunus dulcis TaxID=3755 RepID=A0AAD4Z090_PRUDU|nr:hypothetical protein L3X38_027422 [Prunus dulcis]